MSQAGQAPFRVALVSDTFAGDDGEVRLRARLDEARAQGAELVLLPELPLDPWSPATTVPRPEDAEPPGGPRHRAMAAAARAAGVALVGGAIVIDPATGRRHNTALVFDRTGVVVGSYRKVVLPEEDGFWETSHYEPGDALAPVLDVFALRVTLQICSDINRPVGAHLLAALGAEVILHPRATEAATFVRWRTVLLATALTSGAYVLSVNRPREEQGVRLGGPSFAAAPTGEVLCETVEPVVVVALDRRVIETARTRYPGYLGQPADLYAAGWRQVTPIRRPRGPLPAG